MKIRHLSFSLLAAIPALAQDQAPVQPEQAAPAPAPTEQPAPAPVEQPAPSPVEQPAPAPVEQPAPAPVEQPAPAPVEQPTPAPVEQPAPAPVEQPAPAPVEQPAPAPVEQPAPAPVEENDLTDAYRGIVKVEVAGSRPDYKTPWQSGSFGRGNGTGFMVAPGLFLTNAHVVSYAERIYLMPYADSRRLPAKVKFVSHEADLALVEVQDPSFFENVPCLKLSTELPKLEDSVRCIGYPIGGKRLSVTRGIVSRIDTIKYAHTRTDEHLAVQIDAAINPGNSGGPVLKGDEVIGVAFQGLLEANSTGYVIPAPVIHHFMQDIKDGKYDGYVEIGATFFPLENPALRKHYKLDDNAPGCLVGDVVKGSSCDGLLQIGDVVQAVNGHAVDRSAMIELDGVRVELGELVERAFNGDTMTFTILRNGAVQQVEVKPAPLAAIRVMTLAHDEKPRYIHFGGLIFQPLHFNVISAHDMSANDIMPELNAYLRGGFCTHQDVVVITRLLPDEINARFDSLGRKVVKTVNGEAVKGLSHLYELLYPEDTAKRPPYTVIEVAGAPRPIIIDNATIDAANKRISNSYSIPAPARLNP